jgi:ABC-type Zn uptake system ZnuABC Zn-binding protein ZnuA
VKYLLCLAALLGDFPQEGALRVVATTPDLGALVREVGGDQVDVTVLAKGPEDPHFVEARPGFIRACSQADLYVQVGMELEVGYAPLLLQGARNPRVQPGAPGHVDASSVITPLDVPTGPVDRSHGDVHGAGNPHYLLDPVNGIRVAELLRDRLCAARPSKADVFKSRFDAFKAKVADKLAGPELAKKYDVVKLALLQDAGGMDAFLEKQKDKLGGWWGAAAPFRGAKIAFDHPMWSYFCARFGFVAAGSMEPKPGFAPTTKHLTELIGRMKADGVKAVLAAPYYDDRHARFVSDRSGAKIVPAAHQCGAREGTDDYASMIEHNLTKLLEALR